MANINFQEHSLLFKKSWSQTLGKDVQFESMAYAIKVTHATSPSHTLLLPRPLKGAGITVLPRHVWPTFPEKKKKNPKIPTDDAFIILFGYFLE